MSNISSTTLSTFLAPLINTLENTSGVTTAEINTFISNVMGYINADVDSDGNNLLVAQITALVAKGTLPIPSGFVSPYFPTTVTGINDSGVIVGNYRLSNGDLAGFIDTGGSFSTLAITDTISTQIAGISDTGVIAGNYNTGTANYGFLDNNGTITTLSLPNINVIAISSNENDMTDDDGLLQRVSIIAQLSRTMQPVFH